jgi:hypothetical protein
LKAAGSSFKTGSNAEEMLTALAVIALLISEILLFYVFSKNKRSEEQLNQKIADITIANIELRQEKERKNLANEKLKQIIAELTTTNDGLQQQDTQPATSV